MPPKRKQAAAEVSEDVEKVGEAEPKLKFSKADSDKEDEPIIESAISKKSKAKDVVEAVKRPLRTQTRVNYNENETKVKVPSKPKTAKTRSRKQAVTEDGVNDGDGKVPKVNKASNEEKNEAVDDEEVVSKEVKEKKQKGRKAKAAVDEKGDKTATKNAVDEKADKDEEEVEEEEQVMEVKVTKESKSIKKGRGKKAIKGDNEDETKEEVSKKRRKQGGEKSVKDESDVTKEDINVDIKKQSKISSPVESNSKENKNESNFLNRIDTDLTDLDFTCTKKNKLDQCSNYKIMSWNVDGLRACIKKDGLNYIQKEDADIICLQETKCNEDKLPEEVLKLGGYRKFWANSVTDGYAGVGLFAKNMPIEVHNGIGVEEFDTEGRIITAEFRKFIVVCVYVPNSGRKLVTLDKRLKWNKEFKSYIQKLENRKPLIICGDMNVAHQEIDLANPKTNKKNAGFTKEERDGMTDFLDSGYVDMYRKFYPDETNCYTFWSYMHKSRSKNIGWRLDYFLVSKRYTSTMCDVAIRSNVFGSDHCPIVLFLYV